jgi:RNA polymerase sigma-70 factor (ECF subfamily)
MLLGAGHRGGFPVFFSEENVMAAPEQWQPERYRPYLRALARGIHIDPRLRPRCDESDLVQIALFKAIQKLDQCHAATEAEFMGWLQTILAHTLADEMDKGHTQKGDVAREQSQQAVAESSRRWEQFVSSQPSPSQVAERHEMSRRLTDAIERLPEDQRTVVVQRKLQGATIEEIAKTLGRTEKAVAGLLHRGMLKLRELLQEPE